MIQNKGNDHCNAYHFSQNTLFNLKFVALDHLKKIRNMPKYYTNFLNTQTQPSSYRKPMLKQFVAVLLLMLPTVMFALAEDRQQVLQLRAGQADLNQETHRGIYTHHVELDQGSTHLRAEHAITEVNNDNRLIKAIAKGDLKSQVHFWTLTDQHKPPLHAYADLIRYFPETHRIELIGHARVEQGQDSFSAATIYYDTLHQHVVSNSEGHGQTIIIIHPEKQV